jgi:RNA polymerase sigma-70 factor (ECF subfamily)
VTHAELEDAEALVDAARGGDRSALERLLRLQQPAIHAVCRRITGNDADALDATQEALLAVVRGLPSFDRRSRLSTWTYRIATNASLDELRRRKRRPVPIDDDDSLERRGAPAAARASSDHADAVVAREVIDHALAGLAPEFRAAVVLRDLCELDYAEIAAVLDIPAGTVRSRIARGRAHLADALDGNQTPTDGRPTDTP